MPDGHILIVAPSAYPLGGVATWIDYIVPGLRKRGWRVTLGLTAGFHHNVDAYLTDHPIEGVIRIRNTTGTGEGRVRALCNAITEVKPDIVASANIVDVYRAVNRLNRKGSLSVRAADNRSQSFSLWRKTAIHTAPLFGKIPSPVSPKTLPSAEAAVGGKGV